MEEERDPFDASDLPEIDPAGGLDDLLIFGGPATRRRFLKQMAGTSAAITLGPMVMGMGSPAEAAEVSPVPGGGAPPGMVPVHLKINGQAHALELDPRVTLARCVARASEPDRLEERLRPRAMRRLHRAGQWSPREFLPQPRGRCTKATRSRRSKASPTAMSFIRCRRLSSSTTDSNAATARRARFVPRSPACKEGHAKDDDEIREWMSGNLCRCGAYPEHRRRDQGGARPNREAAVMNPFTYSRATDAAQARRRRRRRAASEVSRRRDQPDRPDEDGRGNA